MHKFIYHDVLNKTIRRRDMSALGAQSEGKKSNTVRNQNIFNQRYCLPHLYSHALCNEILFCMVFFWKVRLFNFVFKVFFLNVYNKFRSYRKSVSQTQCAKR